MKRKDLQRWFLSQVCMEGSTSGSFDKIHFNKEKEMRKNTHFLYEDDPDHE